MRGIMSGEKEKESNGVSDSEVADSPKAMNRPYV